ncbi:transcription antiterminator [Paenibacillus barcinonensis]|uniref:Transcription antiterminator n=1 Tax=Paenibacillus barcinonensis TaxID=198119 RepID=A0A2V4VVB2_PAEBA|nr:BglG family transcription antiterminator [Paenibacillus barcinonensis]PYE49028.1 transcriptional antiterminator [Paenibacillus barcinonensis]QKS55283.1 transcription antiterminator [Paenibacillus barcinonensis]
MNERHLDILLHLLNANTPVTGSALAQLFNVSDRTVRSDIRAINAELLEQKMEIQSSKQRGYYVDDWAKPAIRQRLNRLWEEKPMSVLPDTPVERMTYIVFALSFSTSYIGMEQLAEHIYVSRTTINLDVRRLQEIIEQIPQLELKVSTTKGLLLVGNEISKRALMLYVLQLELTHRKMEIVNRLRIVLPEEQLNDRLLDLQNLIINMLNAGGYFLADHEIVSLSFDFFITFKRIEHGFGIVTPVDENLDHELTATLRKALVGVVDTMDDKEIAYLLQRMRSKRLLSKQSGQLHGFGEEAAYIVDRLIADIQRKFGIPFNENTVLRNHLIQHIDPLINRLKTHTFEFNPLSEETRKRYPFAFEMSNVLVPIIQNQYGLLLNESELAFIALHLAVALEEVFEKPAVAILCGSGLATAQILYRRVMSYYGERLDLIGWYSVYQLDALLREEFGKVDLLITTIPIEQEVNIPLLLVNPLLSKSDMAQIESYLTGSMMVPQPRSEELTDTSFFNEQCFHYFVKGQDYISVLKQMAQSLLKEKAITDVDDFIASVLERERMQSTVFGNAIALPHAMDYQANFTFVSIGVLKEAIKHEGKRIKIVLLVAINPKEKEKLKQLYKVIEHILDREDIKNLSQASQFEQFIKYIY